MGGKRGTALALLLAAALLLCGCQESPGARYSRGEKLLAEGKYAEAAEVFDGIPDHGDAARLSVYAKAVDTAEKGDYAAALAALKTLGDYRDCPMMITYYTGRQYESRADAANWSPWVSAAEYYSMVSLFRDSRERAENCRKNVYEEAERLAGIRQYAQSSRMLAALKTYADSEKLGPYYGAFALEQENRFREASEAFAALGDYRDAAEQAAAVLRRGYEKAETLEKAGKQDQAYEIFISLGGYEDSFERACRPYYELGMAKREEKDWYAAISAFEHAGSYSDAETQIPETRYQMAVYRREQHSWEDAIEIFESLGSYRDATTVQINETNYQKADWLESTGEMEEANRIFASLGRYRDSEERASRPWYEQGLRKEAAQDWDGAVTAFERAGKYRDSRERIARIRETQAAEKQAEETRAAETPADGVIRLALGLPAGAMPE